jgi:hypothetical protein
MPSLGMVAILTMWFHNSPKGSSIFVFCGLFHDAISSWTSKALNDRMISELKDMEGSSHGLI